MSEPIQYAGELAANYTSDMIRDHPINRVTHQTWIEAVGDVDGLSVLDLACGGGYSSRLLAERGARVVGVDISHEMITIAQERELEEPAGITYIVCDAAELRLGKRFDIVTPAFLFNYARDKEQLHKFACTAYRHLKHGGRLVGLNAWHTIVPQSLNSSHWTEWAEPNKEFQEGTKVRLHNVDAAGNPVVSFEYYYWGKWSYEQALQRAGFENVQWIQHRLPDDIRESYPNWRDLEKCNASAVLLAERAN